MFVLTRHYFSFFLSFFLFCIFLNLLCIFLFYSFCILIVHVTSRALRELFRIIRDQERQHTHTHTLSLSLSLSHPLFSANAYTYIYIYIYMRIVKLHVVSWTVILRYITPTSGGGGCWYIVDSRGIYFFYTVMVSISILSTTSSMLSNVRSDSLIVVLELPLGWGSLLTRFSICLTRNLGQVR